MSKLSNIIVPATQLPRASTINRNSVQASGLIAWWPMALSGGSVLYDLTGGGINLSAQNTATYSWGDGLIFSGVGKRFRAPYNARTIVPRFTWSIWFRATDTAPSTIAPLITFDLSGGPQCRYYFDLRGVSPNFTLTAGYYTGADSLVNAAIPTTAMDRRWHHGAAVYDGSTHKVYLDGILKGSGAAGTAPSPSAGICIGYREGTSQEASGGIRDARMYDYALSAAEIWRLYDPATRYELYKPLSVRVYSPTPPAHYVLPADSGAYALTGQDAILEKTSGFSLSADTGSFTETPQDVRLIDSGFLPSEIEGLETWHAADAITGLTDGQTIASWPDSSGNSRTLTQTIETNKPTYEAGVIRGLPVVRLNGTDNWMDYPAITINNEFTIFGVWNAANSGNPLDGDSLGNGGPRIFQLRANATGSDFIGFYAVEPVIVAITHSVGEFHYITAYRTTTHIHIRADGVEASPVAGSGAPVTGSRIMYLGYFNFDTGLNFFGGDIAEMMLFDGELSITDIERVETYLYFKYFAPSAPLTADTGAYALTGQDAALQRGRILVSEETSFAVSGVPAVFPRTIPLDVGSFAFAGQDAAFSSGKGFAHESGTYVFAGQIATLSKILGLQSEAGEFLLTGQSADIMRSGVFVAGDSTNMSFVISDEPGG